MALDSAVLAFFASSCEALLGKGPDTATAVDGVLPPTTCDRAGQHARMRSTTMSSFYSGMINMPPPLRNNNTLTALCTSLQTLSYKKQTPALSPVETACFRTESAALPRPPC